jgi:hypothetical protein
MPGKDGNSWGKGQPLADSTMPRQPTASNSVTLSALAAARAAKQPNVQPAPKSDICRGSTVGGNSPGGTGTAGPVA